MMDRREGDQVSFLPRRGHLWTAKFPGLCATVRNLPGDRFWLDGELVVIDQAGRSCYGSLQESLAAQNQNCLAFYVFDLLWLDGKDLCLEPIEERKRQLQALIGEDDYNLKFVDFVTGNGDDFCRLVCEHELEGIVCKRLGSVYKPSRRSQDWLKKCADFISIDMCDGSGGRINSSYFLWNQSSEAITIVLPPE